MRERNVLLVAAGFAPSFSERTFQDPALAAVRAAVDLVLERQNPYRRLPSTGSGGSSPAIRHYPNSTRAAPRNCCGRRSTGCA